MIILSGGYSPLIIKEDKGRKVLSCDTSSKIRETPYIYLPDYPDIADIYIKIGQEFNARRMLYSENGGKKIISAHLDYDFDEEDLELDCWEKSKREIGNLIFCHVKEPEALLERHLEKLNGGIFIRRGLQEKAGHSYCEIIRCLEDKQNNLFRKII